MGRVNTFVDREDLMQRSDGRKWCESIIRGRNKNGRKLCGWK